jgi:hypothetical protein
MPPGAYGAMPPIVGAPGGGGGGGGGAGGGGGQYHHGGPVRARGDGQGRRSDTQPFYPSTDPQRMGGAPRPAGR